MKVTITDDEVRVVVAQHINEHFNGVSGVPIVKSEHLDQETIYDSFSESNIFTGYTVDLSKI